MKHKDSDHSHKWHDWASDHTVQTLRCALLMCTNVKGVGRARDGWAGRVVPVCLLWARWSTSYILHLRMFPKPFEIQKPFSAGAPYRNQPQAASALWAGLLTSDPNNVSGSDHRTRVVQPVSDIVYSFQITSPAFYRRCVIYSIVWWNPVCLFTKLNDAFSPSMLGTFITKLHVSCLYLEHGG